MERQGSIASLDRADLVDIDGTGEVVDGLFADGVHRVEASVDTEDVEGLQLLEAVGFRHEGRQRSALESADGWRDAESFALLADERASWLARETSSPATVELVEITDANAFDVARLETHHSQRRFVATVAQSYTDALFPDSDDGGGRALPWLRAISADGELAGFVMLADVTATSPDPYLWRFLVDRRHQGRGIGRRAMQQVIDRARAAGHRRLVTSYVEGSGGPQAFYEGLGFVPTGELDEDEIVTALDLTGDAV